MHVFFSHIQNGLTPLHLAAQEDKVNVAEVLLNHGADVNTQTRVRLSLLVNPQRQTQCKYTVLKSFDAYFFTLSLCLFNTMQ